MNQPDPDPVVIVNRELTRDDANWLKIQLERRFGDRWQVVHGRGFLVEPQRQQGVGPTEYKTDEDWSDMTPVPVWLP